MTQNNKEHCSQYPFTFSPRTQLYVRWIGTPGAKASSGTVNPEPALEYLGRSDETKKETTNCSKTTNKDRVIGAKVGLEHILKGRTVL